MTVEVLCARGVRIDEPDAKPWRAHSGPVLPLDAYVESDLTNVSVFLAAGAVTGGCVMVPGWPGSTLQPGARFLGMVEWVGCTTTRSGEAVILSGPGRLRGIDVDLHDVSESILVIMVLVALAEGITRVTGIAHTRGHEVDHLSALTTELRKPEVAVIKYYGGLEIAGGPWGRGGVELSSYADHRMVHFAAIVALDRSGTGVDDLACVSKTMLGSPWFWNQLVAI